MQQQYIIKSTKSNQLAHSNWHSRMMWNAANTLFLLIVFGLAIVYVQPYGECQFCYSKQPPEAPPDCNPYGSSSTALVCQVQGTLGAIFKIKWFFESDETNDKPTELTNSDNIDIESVSKTASDSIHIDSQIHIKDVSIGKYWCQVYHNNNGLLRSQKFGVAAEQDYNRYDNCPENQSFSEQIEKCADISVVDGTSSSCPTIKPGFSTTTLIPSTITIALNNSQPITTISESQTTDSQSHQTTIRTTESSVLSNEPIPTISQTIDPAQLEGEQETQTWLYVVVCLSGTFLLLIIILKAVCILLCLTSPRNKKRRKKEQIQLRQRLDTLTSPVTTDPPSRPLTMMTMQTDIFLGGLPYVQESSVFDRDYEDIDDGKDIEDICNDIPMSRNPRYHEQGPTTVATNFQPIYTIPIQSPNHVQYSEIGSPTDDHHTIPEEVNAASLQTHGYGKLDHTRPRQHYNPIIESPLLSGYRKLDHVRKSTKATTLPHAINSPGYANIDIPNHNVTGCHHFRSISLPSSEYSNLNPNTMSQPTTPSAAITPTSASRKYANFEIIEHWNQEENCEEAASISRHVSEDYQMLADATIDRTDHQLSCSNRDEYEFLPVCMCEEDDEDMMKRLDGLPSNFRQEVENVLMKTGFNSLSGRELIDEKMSVASHSSSDFTGPFVFPHMVNFGQNSEQDRHVYRALDISTMEPQQGYAMINVKEE